ncbi:DNA primase [Sandaracinobacteroides hominis]|uniref:DNA primase n=1 Tax=Sandaracinobacteroides hominis TaxID=2780086 RepID=UPI0018F52D3F|nr:DNA primase [Sandaracinobacteroides hominis]
MSLPPEFLDDLRARIGLAAVVGRRVKLTRAGRELKGCCPFHNEKTPSFYVNEDKGFYHCFGCGAHGDAIRFVTELDGLSFMEAVKSLAAEAGLAVPESRPDNPEARRRAGLYELLEAASDWYRGQMQSVGGADARAYLERRGVSAALQAQFGLGFAPDSRDAMSKALKAKFETVEPPQLLDAGLTGEADDRRYDRFRGRLMFPIHDARGRPVGFGGRILGAGEPKYLNSPEGPVFHKGRLLYNLHRAAPAARKAGRLLVVEGYMDVVGLAGAGILEAVAPLGTALTEDQLQLAWKIVGEPVLAFDGDGAGMRAGLRAATHALPLLAPGRSLALVALPKGKDPDDLAREGGKAAVDALLATALPLERFLFDSEFNAGPLDTPERRAAFKARLKALAGEIADQDIRRDYLHTWLDRADEMLRPARPARSDRPQAAGPRRQGPWHPPVPTARPETRAAARQRAEPTPGMLLRTLSQHPTLVEEVAEALAELPISSASLLLARDHLLRGSRAEPLLSGYAPLFKDVDSEDVLRNRVATAIAHMTESHHLGTEEQQPSDVGSPDDFAREWERQQSRRATRAEANRRMTALAIENDKA